MNRYNCNFERNGRTKSVARYGSMVEVFCNEIGKRKWRIVLHRALRVNDELVSDSDFPQSFLTTCYLINSFGAQWTPLSRNNRNVTRLTQIRAADRMR